MKLSTKLSSFERGKVVGLIKSVVVLLRTEVVAMVLAVMHKGEITIEIRNGRAIEIRPCPHLRKGYEIAKDAGDAGPSARQVASDIGQLKAPREESE